MLSSEAMNQKILLNVFSFRFEDIDKKHDRLNLVTLRHSDEIDLMEMKTMNNSRKV